MARSDATVAGVAIAVAETATEVSVIRATVAESLAPVTETQATVAGIAAGVAVFLRALREVKRRGGQTKTTVLLATAAVFFTETAAFFTGATVFFSETTVAESETTVFLGEATVAVNGTEVLLVGRVGFTPHDVDCSCSGQTFALLYISRAHAGRWRKW